MNDLERKTIQEIETALMGVKWSSDDHLSTLFFFPTFTAGKKGVMRAGNHHKIFKTPLEYEVFLRESNPYLKIIDDLKGETLEYKIEKLSKKERALVIVDQTGKKSNFNFY